MRCSETLKLLGNSCYCYHIMDRCRHTEAKYLNDEKTHKVIEGNLFKRITKVSKELCEIVFVKLKLSTANQ